jgi:hypothetical protein
MTCVLWLLGVEVLPNLHLAHHEDDHTHAADGTIVASHEHEHEHELDHEHGAGAGADHDHDHGDADHDGDADHHDGDADHHDDADADDGDADDRGGADGRDGGQLAIDHPGRRQHQAGGISHHAVALHQPAAPPGAPALVARLTWHLEAPAGDPPRSAITARPTSRGPPAI